MSCIEVAMSQIPSKATIAQAHTMKCLRFSLAVFSSCFRRSFSRLTALFFSGLLLLLLLLSLWNVLPVMKVVLGIPAIGFARS